MTSIHNIKNGKWISVKDALPGGVDNLLILTKNDEMAIANFYVLDFFYSMPKVIASNKKIIDQIESEYGDEAYPHMGALVDDVAYWMYLPEVPEKPTSWSDIGLHT